MCSAHSLTRTCARAEPRKSADAFRPWGATTHVRTDESTGFSESGKGIARPVERLDLVETIAHSPRSRAATVLTSQPRINPHAAATWLRGERSHLLITPPPPPPSHPSPSSTATPCAFRRLLGRGLIGAEAAHAVNYLPLSSNRGHGRACCRLDPVTDSPDRKIDTLQEAHRARVPTTSRSRLSETRRVSTASRGGISPSSASRWRTGFGCPHFVPDGNVEVWQPGIVHGSE
jgi:hypothetical protein